MRIQINRWVLIVAIVAATLILIFRWMAQMPRDAIRRTAAYPVPTARSYIPNVSLDVTCVITVTCTPEPTWTPEPPTVTSTPQVYITVCYTPTVGIMPTGTPTELSTSTPTVTAIPATPLPGLGSERARPSVYRFVWEGEANNIDHTIPGAGGVLWFAWDQLNHGRGNYNWGLVHERLNSLRGRPAIIQVHVHDSDWSGGIEFEDHSPAWVKAFAPTHILVSGGARCALPAYDNAEWRMALIEFVNAMGREFDKDPRIYAVDICYGLDGETWPVKEGAANWPALMLTQAPNVNRYYHEAIYDMMDVYRNAWPSKLVFIMNAAGGAGVQRATAEYAARIGVGIKKNCWKPDDADWHGVNRAYGKLNAFETYRGVVPLWLETWTGAFDDNNAYWMMFVPAHFGVAGVNSHPELFRPSLAPYWRWLDAHLNNMDANTTPSAWIVLRDSEYIRDDWGLSGWPGDWRQFMSRTTDAPRVWERDLPAGKGHAAARQCRTTGYGNRIAFEMDAQFSKRNANGFAVQVTLLDYGRDRFSLQYMRADGGIIERWAAKTGTNTWRTFTFDCSDMRGSAFILHDGLDGIEYVHMLEVTPQ